MPPSIAASGKPRDGVLKLGYFASLQTLPARSEGFPARSSISRSMQNSRVGVCRVGFSLRNLEGILHRTRASILFDAGVYSQASRTPSARSSACPGCRGCVHPGRGDSSFEYNQASGSKSSAANRSFGRHRQIVFGGSYARPLVDDVRVVFASSSLEAYLSLH